MEEFIELEISNSARPIGFGFEGYLVHRFDIRGRMFYPSTRRILVFFVVMAHSVK
jgi:hypothetical protein